MKFILSLLISLLYVSCSHKNTSASNLLGIDEFLNKPISKMQEKYSYLKQEDLTIIAGKSYVTWSLIENNEIKLQALSSLTTSLVLEIIKYSTEKNTNEKNEYTDIYKPKCETDAVVIKYNKISNQITLLKNEVTIFYGTSLIVQDRINDDKIKKCINSWGH